MALALTESNSANSANKPLAIVTGASGFIGHHLCRGLRDAGFAVKALVRSNCHLEAADLSADQIYSVELGDSRLSTALSGASVVFHLAGIAHTGVRDGAALQRVNVQGSKIIAQACKTAGVPRLIHFSSILAEDPGQSAYALSKHDSELAVLGQADEQLAVVVLRPVGVYGPGMRGNWYGLIKRIAARRMPPLPRLHNRLALVSVHDLCRAAVLFAQAPIPQSGFAPYYVVCDGQEYSPNQLESAIYGALGRNKPAWHTPRMLFFAAAALADMAGKLGILRGGFGLGSYRNLVRDSAAGPEAMTKLQETIAYRPSQTFADVLPDLVVGMDKQK